MWPFDLSSKSLVADVRASLVAVSAGVPEVRPSAQCHCCVRNVEASNKHLLDVEPTVMRRECLHEHTAGQFAIVSVWRGVVDVANPHRDIYAGAGVCDADLLWTENRRTRPARAACELRPEPKNSLLALFDEPSVTKTRIMRPWSGLRRASRSSTSTAARDPLKRSAAQSAGNRASNEPYRSRSSGC